MTYSNITKLNINPEGNNNQTPNSGIKSRSKQTASKYTPSSIPPQKTNYQSRGKGQQGNKNDNNVWPMLERMLSMMDRITTRLDNLEKKDTDRYAVTPRSTLK